MVVVVVVVGVRASSPSDLLCSTTICSSEVSQLPLPVSVVVVVALLLLFCPWGEWLLQSMGSAAETIEDDPLLSWDTEHESASGSWSGNRVSIFVSDAKEFIITMLLEGRRTLPESWMTSAICLTLLTSA